MKCKTMAAAHLLVAVVDIDVGIGGDVEGNAHQGLHEHEADGHHGRLVVVLVDDGQPVVAAHFQSAAFVGYGQGVVGV